jgi:hypothetical protein
MKIYIQRKRVITVIPERTLFCPIKYMYSSKSFKLGAIKRRDEAQKALETGKS